ncbi:MAG TPA: asparaginase [Actinomycetota bacterium]|nr:asparaginase [Actinomycetota bacterium]
MRSAEPLARVVRSGLEESVHLGHVAVCDASGRLVARVGDPDRTFFVRSCTKPVQASVSLTAIGPDERVPVRSVAIMCASHNGEPVHVRAVREVLRRGGLTEEDLRTPPARPSDPASASRVRASRPVFHNCSGKHAGMLLASVRRGWPTLTYRARSHPLQRRVLAAVRELSGIDDVAVGIDGCGVPVHAMPLRSIATMYARLAAPERQGRLAPAVRRSVEAMRAEPYLVGGRNRVDTAIMTATSDLVAKEGAEALICAVSLEAGLGVAVKVGDGGYRAAGPAMIQVLEELGLLTSAARRALGPWAEPPVLGGGRPVGRLEPVLHLRGRR